MSEVERQNRAREGVEPSGTVVINSVMESSTAPGTAWQPAPQPFADVIVGGFNMMKPPDLREIQYLVYHHRRNSLVNDDDIIRWTEALIAGFSARASMLQEELNKFREDIRAKSDGTLVTSQRAPSVLGSYRKFDKGGW